MGCLRIFQGDAQVYLWASLMKLAPMSLLSLLGQCVLCNMEHTVQVVDICCIQSQSFYPGVDGPPIGSMIDHKAFKSLK